MPDYSNAYVPASSNLASSVAAGISSGHQWAQMKMTNDYRKQELDRQYAQIQNQMAEHKLSVMEKSGGNWLRIAQTDPKKRGPLIKWASTQDNMMGIDSSGMATLAKDPNFYLDVAGPMQKYLQGLKGANPQQVTQGFQEMQNAMADPIMLREFGTKAAASFSQEYKQNQAYANQKELVGMKNDLKEDTQGSKDLTTYQKMLNTAEYRKIQGQIDEAETVRNSIDQAKENPVANNLLPIQILRTMLPRLNAVEIQKAGGSQAITEKFSQIAKEMASGTLTEANAGYMHDFIDNIEQGSVQKKFNLENNVANQYSQKTGLPVDQAYQQLTGNPYPKSSDDQKSKSSAAIIPADQKDKVMQWIQLHQKAGTSNDEIKSQIKKNLGVDFSDDDLKAAGQYNIAAPQPSAPPAAEPATPPQAPPAPSPAVPDSGTPNPLPAPDNSAQPEGGQ